MPSMHATTMRCSSFAEFLLIWISLIAVFSAVCDSHVQSLSNFESQKGCIGRRACKEDTIETNNDLYLKCDGNEACRNTVVLVSDEHYLFMEL